MEKYDAFVFGWKDEPIGGLDDLIVCCDTVIEAIDRLPGLSREGYDVLQVMRADGVAVRRCPDCLDIFTTEELDMFGGVCEDCSDIDVQIMQDELEYGDRDTFVV